MYEELIKISHPTQIEAVNNYTSTVSRTFKYVQDYLVRNGSPAKHWSDLLSHPEAINEFLDKCVHIRYIGRLILNIMLYFFLCLQTRRMRTKKIDHGRQFEANQDSVYTGHYSYAV